MSDTVTVAIISASGSVLTAITALILTFRLFDSLERRISVIESDLKEFFKHVNDHEHRIGHLENRQ